jgi:hypothetical protein
MLRTRSAFVFVLALVAGALGMTPGAALGATATECSGSLTGSFENIRVPAGATCTLDGATVSGSIRVGDGATLITDDSTVAMNVFARDAASVQLIDTVALGEINLQRTSGGITIGSEGCAVDPVADGNIVLLDNDGPIAVCFMTLRNLIVQRNSDRIGLFHNDVSNNLIVTQNSGRVIRVRDNVVGGNTLITQNTSSKLILVKANTVSGNIGCTGNTLVPTVTTNTVGGSYQGQCAI